MLIIKRNVHWVLLSAIILCFMMLHMIMISLSPCIDGIEARAVDYQKMYENQSNDIRVERFGRPFKQFVSPFESPWNLYAH